MYSLNAFMIFYRYVTLVDVAYSLGVLTCSLGVTRVASHCVPLMERFGADCSAVFGLYGLQKTVNL